MRQLSYIKDLLLLNDCVIIPGFGGFVTNYKSAKTKSSTLYPPGKEIGFNGKLKFNDGLFVNHVADQDGLNYVTASQQVDLLVKEINYRLVDGEKVSVPEVGELFYNENDQLIFEPDTTVNFNLDSYGLTTFQFETLYAKKMSRSKIRIEERDAVEVLFQNRTLKKVMIGLPLVIALAFFPIKNSNENILKSDLSALTEMTTSAEPVKTVEAKPEIEISEAIPEVVEENNYFLIGGSFRDRSNAERFLQQKIDEGFDAENIGVIKGLNYIAVGSFPDFASAKSKQLKIKNDSPECGVWIYHKK